MKNKNIGPRAATRSMLEKDVPPKKKKKLSAGSRELVAVVDGKPTKVLAKKTERQLAKTFGERSHKIMEMIEMGDEDGGLTLLKKALLQATVRILPMAEEIMEETKAGRGTYQFVTLVSQIRELITDIQADQDRKYIANAVINNVLKPAFMDVAQDILTEHHVFRSKVESMLQPGRSQEFNSELMKLAKVLARNMTIKYREVEEKTFEAMKN